MRLFNAGGVFVFVAWVLVMFAVPTAGAQVERGYDIPMLDLDAMERFHTVVAKDLDKPNQYLGHPTTVLLDDGKTIFAVFPTGHGKGDLRLMRSFDAGLSWEQMASPGIKLHEVPTIFKLKRPDGKTRLLITTCIPRQGTFQWTYSDDAGKTWVPMRSKDIGLKNGIIVALASFWRVLDEQGDATGTWRGAFHDFKFDNYTIDLLLKADEQAPGGYRCAWTMAKRIGYASDAGLQRGREAGLCEPGVIRSPDSQALAMLFRPQHKKTNAMISFSKDQGGTWSDPVEMPGSLTGERHVGKYAPDGRLLICFRDYSPLNPGNPSHGDWVAWVGSWDDLINGKPGDYRVRLKNNFGNSTNNGIGDCGYTGVEVLADGTCVCITYGHWQRNDAAPAHPNATEGRGRPPYILATRFKLTQLDALLAEQAAALQTLTLPAVFADGMVLQRDQPVHVWGKGKPGESVAVRFAGQSVSTAVDKQGRWRVALEPMSASRDNRVMQVTSGDESLTVNDVLVGEVWMLAGQSNMDFALGGSTGGGAIAQAIGSNASIRLLDPPKTVPSGAAAWPLQMAQQLTPQTYFGKANWAQQDRQAAERFSAVGAVFGLRLYDALDVPIGLIDVSVGGSTTESWVPRDAVLAEAQLAPLERDFLDTPMVQDFVHTRPRQHLAHWLNAGRPGKTPEHPYRAGFLYDAAITPIAPLSIAGVLWYQGESNAEDVADHNKLFTLAVRSWRGAFDRPTLPVYAVQLPELNRECWPEFREAQQQLARSIPHTALAVALGNGHPSNVHPRDKTPVGDRLAKIALKRTYGKDIEDTGPTLTSTRRVGASMQLQFDHVARSLELNLPGNSEPRKDQPTGFWVAGEDKVFYPAYFEEKQGNTLWLTHPEVPKPIAVRYAWEANVTPTLYNSEGLPAAPFRTDDWRPIRIACVGDSITHGTGTSNPDTHSYPAQLSQWLGPLFDVRRFGVPGASVVNGLIQPGTGWNRGYITQRALDRSLVFEPDVVIINLGINDVVNESFNSDVFIADYRALISAYRRLPSKPSIIIWHKLSPLFPGQAFYDHPRLDEIHRALGRLVKEAGVETIDMNTPLAGFAKHFPDKLHPNAEGAAIIAQTTRDRLRELGQPVAADKD